MCDGITRRGLLRMLALALPAGLWALKDADWFDRELVCAHVFHPAADLAAPLCAPGPGLSPRPPNAVVFQIGLPELILCQSQTRLLDMFPYFWPVERAEVARLKDSMRVLFRVARLQSAADLESLDRAAKAARRKSKAPMAAILTINDYTRPACAQVAGICRAQGVDELVIFKDPSKPPYLCSYPALQKGIQAKSLPT